MEIEKTFVIMKPETIKRGIVGDIISRFEKRGLKIIGMKMVWPDEKFVSNHYTEELALSIGTKTKAAAEKRGEKFEIDPTEHGMNIVKRLRKHLTECPVVALVLEGPHAIELIRKMVGSTEPRSAEPGTIRGDYTADSYALGDNVQKRSIRNIIHASDSVESAEKEIKLWFKDSELFKYDHPLQKVMYDY